MKIPVDSNGYQDIFSISQNRKIQNQGKMPCVEINEIVLSPCDLTSQQNTIQTVNKALMGLAHKVILINKEVTGYESPNRNANLEEVIEVLIEGINDVLRVIKEANSVDHMTISESVNTTQDSLSRLLDIIVAAVKVSESLSKEGPTDISSIGIKLTHNGSLSLDSKALKEAISLNSGEVSRTVKTATASLFKMLPLCIDPNSGNLIFVGRRVEEGGDENASRVAVALNEKLENERTELVKKLNIAESLISHSDQFICGLKLACDALL